MHATFRYASRFSRISERLSMAERQVLELTRELHMGSASLTGETCPACNLYSYV